MSAQANGDSLTARQREVLDLVARGYTNAQIGERLGISLDGAKWHVSEVLSRLNLDSREEAADYWRAQSGLRPRLLRFARGLGAALSWKVLAGAGVAAAALAGAILALVVFGGSEDPEQATPASSTPGASVTVAPSITPSATVSPAPSPTLSPTPATATPVTIGGVTAPPLAIAIEQPVPPGAVVYFTQVRPQSETINRRLWRAYRDGNNELHFDDLTAPLRERSKVGADPYTLAMSEDGSTIMAGVCVEMASCGIGIMRPRQPGEAIPASLQSGPDGIAFRSTDGGVTWEELGPLPWSHGFVAVLPEGTIVAGAFVPGTNDFPYYWFETGETIEPPIADGYPTVVPGAGLVWQPRTSENGPWVDAAGEPFYEPLFPDGAGESVIAVNADGSRLVEGLTRERGGGTWFLAKRDAAGNVTAAVSTPFVLRAIPAPPFGDSAVIFWGQVTDDPRYLPYLVDLEAGFGALPLTELTQVVEQHMSPVVMAVSGFGTPLLRVETGGECLNLRMEPDEGAEVMDCLADGVLLWERGGEPQEGWIAVLLPGGPAGWVSNEFVTR